MNDLKNFYENFDDDNISDDDNQLTNEIIMVHEFARYADARIAVYSGKRLIKLKKNNYGRLEELYKEIGISKQTASNYVILAKKYGKNPEVLEGMSQRKAILIAKQSEEENIVRFIADELWRDPQGNIRTTFEVRELLIKDEENKNTSKINVKNKKISELEEENVSFREENATMKKQDEERDKIIEESLSGESKTLYETLIAAKEQSTKKDERINELELKLQQMEEQKYGEQEVIEAIETSKRAISDAHTKINNVKIEHFNRKLRAKIDGYLQEARELITWTAQSYENQIDESMDDDSTYKSNI